MIGCASWEMELDAEMPEEYSSQAGRLAKYRSVHCLSSSFMNVLESVAWFRKSADLSQCLSFVDSKESPIACYSGRHDPHVVKLADFRRLCLQRRVRQSIAHGSMVGLRRRRSSSVAESQLFIQSVPKILCHPSRSKNKLTLFLEQPACGRNLWDDVAILQEMTSVKVLPGMNIGDSIGLEVSKDDVTALQCAKLVCEIPFDPPALIPTRRCLSTLTTD